MTNKTEGLEVVATVSDGKGFGTPLITWHDTWLTHMGKDLCTVESAQAAVAAEREACAQLVESSYATDEEAEYGAECAADIRARSNT